MADNADILAIAQPQVASDEGCRLTAYPDPLSGADPWTVGYGSTGPGIVEGTVWTQEQADADLQNRLGSLCGSLDSRIPWWRNLDAIRAAVLVNMSYNMGVGGLMGFPHMLSCAQVGNYSAASAQMLDSAWAKQVPNRANRLATQMQTGVQSYP
jgi:lysozyme